MNELKDRVSTLERQLRERRAQAPDPTVLNDVEYVYVEVERINSRPVTIETYQSTLLSLSVVRGRDGRLHLGLCCLLPPGP